MRKTISILTLLITMSLASFCQINLVPNFSFEEHDSCPTGPDQIERATGWLKFSTAISTPDYYNSCSAQFNVPNSGNGFQTDQRNCTAFIGLVTFGAIANDREHVGIKLNQPLVIGQKYFISFNIVFAEEVLGVNLYHFSMPSNKVGMRLSTVQYSISNPAPIDNFAHLFTDSLIGDSVSWHLISGSVVADSNYQYVILGNFFDDTHTDTIHFNCPTCMNSLSYYYIDDICVSTDSILCSGGINQIPCNVGFESIEESSNECVVPNPTTSSIWIKNISEEAEELQVYSAMGEIVFKSTVGKNRNYEINLKSSPSGLFYIILINNKGQTKLIKCLKI